MGDFNEILKRDETSFKGDEAYWNRRMHKGAIKQIEKLIKEKSLIDPHKCFVQKIKFTHTHHSQIKVNNCKLQIRSRLDRIYLTKYLARKIINYRIIPTHFSDHDTVAIKLTFGNLLKWGKGNWKLNASLLKDEEFNNRIKAAIDTHFLNKLDDQHETFQEWDNLKETMKKIAIARSIEINKAMILEKVRLENLMLETQEKIDNNVNTNINQSRLKMVKQQLKEMEDDKLEGIKIRSRIDMYENDERPTAYFFNKEKQRTEAKQINCLLDRYDNEQTEPDKIIEIVHDYYTDLYKSEGIDMRQANENINHIVDTLTEEEADELDKYISEKEIETALKQMKNNKSPGDDGLTKEFYAHFYLELKDDLTEVLNTIILRQELPKSQRNALIRLLYKKNDHRMLKNWRPVSLLNVDYKILSKIMTNRLSEVMKKLVPLEQKCGVKGRQMTDIIRNIDLICEDLDQNGGYLICIDQEKAFDRVNHEYLKLILTKLGLKGKFMKIITAMYKNITSQVLINGAKTNIIPIERSIRQGCSFSMLLFVLLSVPLLNMLKNNKSITGYTNKRNRRMVVQAYADDTTIITTQPTDYEEILKTYDKHARASEAKINEHKTEILKIGKPNKRGTIRFEEKIQDKIKILGTLFTKNRDNIGKENLAYVSQKIKPILENKAKKYSLGILGKTLIVNTQIYSKLNHMMWILRNCNQELTKFTKNITDFVIPGFPNHEQEINMPKHHGGSGMINIKKRILATKLRMILQGKEQNQENDNLHYYMGTRGQKIFGKQTNTTHSETIPETYKQTFKIFLQKNQSLVEMEKLKIKKIEKEIDDEIHFWPYGKILDHQYPRQAGLNFQIIKGLIRVRPAEPCFLCGRAADELDHLLLVCEALQDFRNEILSYVKILGGKDFIWNKDNIIYSIGIDNRDVKFIISEYKFQVIKFRKDVILGSKSNIKVIKNRFNKELNFYITHIAPV